jgi:hypothetical protein
VIEAVWHHTVAARLELVPEAEAAFAPPAMPPVVGLPLVAGRDHVQLGDQPVALEDLRGPNRRALEPVVEAQRDDVHSGELLGRARIDGDTRQLDHRPTVLIHPLATRASTGRSFELHRAAVQSKRRVIPKCALASVTLDVVADQRPAKAGAAVRLAAMDQGPIEEENVARIHDNGDELCVVGKWHGDVREALARVGADRAENRPIVTVGTTSRQPFSSSHGSSAIQAAMHVPGFTRR